MNESPILFNVLIVMVFIWFALTNKLFNILKERHQSKYIALGEPSLIYNNSIKNGMAVFKFIAKREYKNLDDSSLNLLCNFMIGYFFLYLFIFVALIVTSIIYGAP